MIIVQYLLELDLPSLDYCINGLALPVIHVEKMRRELI